MNACPDCGNGFVQPFRCVSCGAQKLYDHTVTSQAATIDALRAENTRLRDEVSDVDALRARVAELEVIAISICAGNCLPPFPCAQDGCPKRAHPSAPVVHSEEPK